MARFMARNSKWPENIFYGQRGANMARFEKSGHQMANLAALFNRPILFLRGWARGSSDAMKNFLAIFMELGIRR